MVKCLRQHEYGKEHRSFRATYYPIGRLRMRRCGLTPGLRIVVAHAPTSSYEEEEEVEAFYIDLEKFYRKDRTFSKVIIGDFDARVGPRRTPGELHIGTLQWNEEGKRLSEFIMTTKPSSLRCAWKSPDGGYHNEIDHIILRKG